MALIAFAGNSVLCRLALADNTIDPLNFTVLRLFSGALTLLILVFARKNNNSLEQHPMNTKSIITSSMLFIYAITFSYAYITIPAAIGALVLFSAVQFTMLVFSWYRGERLTKLQLLGLALSLCGLIYLLMPDLHLPSWQGFILMTISGVAWGIYTLNGQKSQQPLLDTRNNFILTLPLVIIISLIFFDVSNITLYGTLLAVASGAITSAIGYALWYTITPYYSSIQAGTLQLTVPMLTALGGILFINENITIQLIMASLLILLGLLIVMLNKPTGK